MKIAIIGKGNVGSAIGCGLSGKHEVKYGHRDPAEPVADAAKWGEVIVLAVPHDNVNDAIEEIQPYTDGKVVIDVTNAIGSNMELGISCATSTAEEIQKKLPKARVVKAFNTVFSANQSTGKMDGQQLTAFMAGDDLQAKQTVAQLTSDIGFDPVDCGPLRAARYLDAMGVMIMQLSLLLWNGTKNRLQTSESVSQENFRIFFLTTSYPNNTDLKPANSVIPSEPSTTSMLLWLVTISVVASKS